MNHYILLDMYGGMVHSLKSGDSLKVATYKAYMKNTSTAAVYSRGLRVLFPNFDWNKAGVDTSDMDEEKLSFHMQSWRAFVDDKIGI